MTEWMDSSEVAELLGISPRTLDNWCHCRKIKYCKPGRKRRFRRSDVMDFLAESGPRGRSQMAARPATLTTQRLD
ncbi:helix-turn-helix domain-containing protein [Iamia sp. SCSIO 61187]|uniref:helix-turn-helix domain-containing protein n=1 Tax=Iamia sp. SCSIO 61187 TaxID=2722752 RepID=UPI001C6323CB|nr:helix-turn-helix domain-containing protein [Iamia sp. SCSIO 61187]QYG94500.1 helix-turn-helix domain-containing protein [Iamia sp. SCSIO 61187]